MNDFSSDAGSGKMPAKDASELISINCTTLVTQQLQDPLFEISKFLRDKVENGKRYFEMHGSRIRTPGRIVYRRTRKIRTIGY